MPKKKPPYKWDFRPPDVLDRAEASRADTKARAAKKAVKKAKVVTVTTYASSPAAPTSSFIYGKKKTRYKRMV